MEERRKNFEATAASLKHRNSAHTTLKKGPQGAMKLNDAVSSSAHTSQVLPSTCEVLLAKYLHSLSLHTRQHTLQAHTASTHCTPHGSWEGQGELTRRAWHGVAQVSVALKFVRKVRGIKAEVKMPPPVG